MTTTKSVVPTQGEVEAALAEVEMMVDDHPDLTRERATIKHSEPAEIGINRWCVYITVAVRGTRARGRGAKAMSKAMGQGGTLAEAVADLRRRLPYISQALNS